MDRHPMSEAWDDWKASNPTLFNGTASAEYLSNRLSAAFSAGWFEAEQRVREALGTNVRMRKQAVAKDGRAQP
jgi:hypothetical protein